MGELRRITTPRILFLCYNTVQEEDKDMELHKSASNRVIAGVCGGLAESLDLNATGLRWAVALVSLLLTGIPVIVYLVLWAILKTK